MPRMPSGGQLDGILPPGTTKIMRAREIAHHITLGKKRLSEDERLLLAEGFQECDRQRAEAVRERDDARAFCREYEERLPR